MYPNTLFYVNDLGSLEKKLHWLFSYSVIDCLGIEYVGFMSVNLALLFLKKRFNKHSHYNAYFF